MFVLKNAWISITRNKGRNILIGVIILVIACACTITLAINNTASDLINSYKSAYDKEITLSFDRSSMMKNRDLSNKEEMEDLKESFNNIATYSVEDVKNFAKNEHIKNYNYTYNISLNGNSIEKATSESETNAPSFGDNKSGGDMNKNSMDFTLNGYSSVGSMSEFVKGTYTMSEITDNAWDIAFDGNYVFINKELAIYNNLSLNDKITLEDESGKTYEFEVIGIFEDNDKDNDSMKSMFSNSTNKIITNADALVSIDEENDSISGTVVPTFVIDSYDNAKAIQKDFYNKGLDKKYIVETNQEVAESGVSSVQSVKTFSTTFLIITLVIGGVVLLIINMINIRERKYEIGVLRTIGISKIKLTLQFVSELLIVAFVAIIIGAGIGATMSKGVSNSLLASEISNTEKETKEMKNNFGGPNAKFDGGMSNSFNKLSGVPNVQTYDSIDAVVNIKVILELLAIGLSLIIVSSTASMISIQRFSPLTILKERS